MSVRTGFKYCRVQRTAPGSRKGTHIICVSSRKCCLGHDVGQAKIHSRCHQPHLTDQPSVRPVTVRVVDILKYFCNCGSRSHHFNPLSPPVSSRYWQLCPGRPPHLQYWWYNKQRLNSGMMGVPAPALALQLACLLMGWCHATQMVHYFGSHL